TDPSQDHILGTVSASDGPLQLKMQAVDQAGNTTLAMRTVKVDGTKPSLTVDKDGTWTNQPSYPLTGTASDNVGRSGRASVKVSNGVDTYTATLKSDSTWSATVPLTSNNQCTSGYVGDNKLTVTASDTAGNATTKTVTIKFDSCVPQIGTATASMYSEDLD